MQAVDQGLLVAHLRLVGVGQAGVVGDDRGGILGEGNGQRGQAAGGVERVAGGERRGRGLGDGVVADAQEVLAAGTAPRIPLHGATRDVARRRDDVGAHGHAAAHLDVGAMHSDVGEESPGRLGDDQVAAVVVRQAQAHAGAVGNDVGGDVGDAVGDGGGDGGQVLAGGEVDGPQAAAGVAEGEGGGRTG